jgi:hypothetical protein
LWKRIRCFGITAVIVGRREGGRRTVGKFVSSVESRPLVLQLGTVCTWKGKHEEISENINRKNAWKGSTMSQHIVGLTSPLRSISLPAPEFERSVLRPGARTPQKICPCTRQKMPHDIWGLK